MSTHKPLKKSLEVAERLTQVAKVIKKGVLNNQTGPIADMLLQSLEMLVNGEVLCTAVVTLGSKSYIDDFSIAMNPPAPMVFELAGRLQSIASRVALVASREDSNTSDDSLTDHIGHGCPLDPTKSKQAPN